MVSMLEFNEKIEQGRVTVSTTINGVEHKMIGEYTPETYESTKIMQGIDVADQIVDILKDELLNKIKGDHNVVD